MHLTFDVGPLQAGRELITRLTTSIDNSGTINRLVEKAVRFTKRTLTQNIAALPEVVEPAANVEEEDDFDLSELMGDVMDGGDSVDDDDDDDYGGSESERGPARLKKKKKKKGKKDKKKKKKKGK